MERGYSLRSLETIDIRGQNFRDLSWNPESFAPRVIATCANGVLKIFEFTSTGARQRTRVVDLRGDILRCAWSPSGVYMLTGGSNEHSTGFVCLYKFVGLDSAPDECQSCVLDRPITSLSWNASSSYFAATLKLNRNVFTWKLVERGEGQLAKMSRYKAFGGHSNAVNMVLWHPLLDDLLVSCSSDHTIKVWKHSGSGRGRGRGRGSRRPDILESVQTLGARGHAAGSVRAVSFNASGDKMVSCSDDLSLKIWGADIEMMRSGHAFWAHIFTLPSVHNRLIRSVHWSRQGIICSGSADGSLCFFREDNQRNGHRYRLVLRKSSAHMSMEVNTVQWSCTDGTILATAGADSNLRTWKLVSPPS